jgi:hypothetical protein
MFTAHDFSPDDSLIVLDDTGRTGYSIVDADTGAELWKVDGFAYQFSNDSRYFVVLDLQGLGSKDCHYRIYESRSGKLLNEALPPRPKEGAMQPQFHLSPDGGYILASDDSTGTWMLRVR